MTAAATTPAPHAELRDLVTRLEAMLDASSPDDAARFVGELRAVLAPSLAGDAVTSLATLHLMSSLTALDLFDGRRAAEARLRVALHEAGHATIAVVLGLPLKSVTIAVDPIAVSGGCVRLCEALPIHAAFSLEDRLAVERYMLLQLAGPMAEEIGGMRPEREDWRRHEEMATRLALLIRPPMSDPELWPFVGYLTARARGLLLQHWPAVLALQEALLFSGPTLDGARATTVVLDALRTPHVAAREASPAEPASPARREELATSPPPIH